MAEAASPGPLMLFQRMVAPVVHIRISKLWFCAIHTVETEAVEVASDIFLDLLYRAFVIAAAGDASAWLCFEVEILETIKDFIHWGLLEYRFEWPHINVYQVLLVIVQCFLPAFTIGVE